MADYRSPTVIQQMIPVSEMTSLEHLLLTNIFDAEPHEDKLYLSTYESPAALIWVSRAELEAALAAPENAIYKKVTDFVEDLQKTPASETSIMLDVSMMSWEEMLQNIIKRSSTLNVIYLQQNAHRRMGWLCRSYHAEIDQRQGHRRHSRRDAR
jgi:hypothetical protein